MHKKNRNLFSIQLATAYSLIENAVAKAMQALIMSPMKKNKAAQALGKLGGESKSKAKRLAAQSNIERARQARWPKEKTSLKAA